MVNSPSTPTSSNAPPEPATVDEPLIGSSAASPAEPAPSLRPVEEIRADMAELQHAPAIRWRVLAARLTKDIEPLLARLAAADRENAELRGEVERHEVFMRAIKDCRDDPARAIAQNDIINGKAIIAAHVAETERDDLRAQLAAAQAQLAEAQEHADMSDKAVRAWERINGEDARRQKDAEARLEAVRARIPAIKDWIREDGDIPEGSIEISFREIDAALSAAPQPEPDSSCGNCGADFPGEHTFSDGMHLGVRELIHCPPASDEPARCEHDWDFMQPASTCRRCGAEWADTQTSPAPTTPTPECRHCGGSGNAHTFDGAELGICGTCHGTGSAAGGSHV